MFCHYPGGSWWVTKTICTQKEANAFSLWNNNLGYQGILEYLAFNTWSLLYRPTHVYQFDIDGTIAQDFEPTVACTCNYCSFIFLSINHFISKQTWLTNYKTKTHCSHKYIRLLSKLVPRQTHYLNRYILDYGCVVYCSLSAADTTRLEQLQYKAGLIVTGGIQGNSYLKWLRELGWSTLSERRRYFQATTMYKIVNGTSPIYYKTLFLELNLEISLRNADHLQVSRFRLSITEKSFRVSGIRLWNSLPRPLRKCASISFFKTKF
jgi:hypothetical protein